MPIPEKKKNETPKKFIQRCMQDEVMVKEYPNKQQRLAVCSTKLRFKS